MSQHRGRPGSAAAGAGCGLELQPRRPLPAHTLHTGLPCARILGPGLWAAAVAPPSQRLQQNPSLTPSISHSLYCLEGVLCIAGCSADLWEWESSPPKDVPQPPPPAAIRAAWQGDEG